jgi:1,4-alpha-glucan branching enzyme
MGTLSNLMQRDKEAATEFFRYMNDSLKTMHKGIILVAEDLTAYSNVTKSVSEGGLGFDYKWDKCWCQDTLQYFQTNPRDRERIKDSISIDLEYLQNEQAVLAVSHDDVVYGRAAVIQKMYGDYEQKFAQARTFYAYMMIHPGKKLLFMGGEIAHFREWDVKREQDWNLLDFPKHRQFAEYIKKLNNFYMETEMLYDDKAAANQLSCENDKPAVFVFERRQGGESCIAVFNLQETASDVVFALDMDKKLVPVINSDSAEFGGSGAKQTAVYSNGGKAVIKMPGFSAVIYLVKECGEDERQAFEQENQPVENVKAPEQENVSVENAVSKEADVSVTGIVADDKEQTVKLVDGPWYDRAVVYHIYTLGYCGAPDYNEGEKTKGSRILCVLDQIPHLKELGINTIYFGPIFESGWHGYDTNDYYMTDSRLGTIEDFKTVFKELKNNGIRIVLDGVFNHVGRGFGPFIDLQKNREQSKYRDWFCNINFGGRSGGGDSFSYDTWQGNWELVKLNMRNPAVVEHLLNAVKMWIDEFDIDGLRLDAADCIDKEFFKRLKTFTEGQKKDFWLMGEIIHGDYKMWANPDMMHSVTNYECWKGIYSSHNDKNYFEIAHSLRRQFERGGIYENLRLYNFLDNHDVNRIASLLKDKRDLSNAYTLMFTMPGIPSIYYGSEWAVPGVKTKGREADKPVRQPIAQILEGELDQRPAECIKELTRFRRNSNALIYGNYENVMIKNMQLVIARNYENETVIAAFNIADNAEHFSFDYRGRKYEFTLEPHSNVVYQNI